MRTTKQCHECKQQFRYADLVEYTGIDAQTPFSYCAPCLEKRISRDNFNIKVRQIFGIKSPGPRIWTERKRLQDRYGYTDDTLADCLDYIYTVEKKKKFAESLCLINPETVNKMMQWKRSEEYKVTSILYAAQQAQSFKEYTVPIKENTKSNKTVLNADDFLND